MALAKNGQIGNCCAPNALMTLQEYLEDYASNKAKNIGRELILKELGLISSERVRQITETRLKEILAGKRDFRF